MKTKDYNIILINIDGFRKDKIDSCVTLKKANHIGRLSDFTLQAAKKNF